MRAPYFRLPEAGCFFMRQNRAVFFCSLGTTLFLLLTAVGLITVDSRGRQLTFGEDTPAFEKISLPQGKTCLEIRLFGQEKEVDITKIDDFFSFLLDFGCIPHN